MVHHRARGRSSSSTSDEEAAQRSTSLGRSRRKRSEKHGYDRIGRASSSDSSTSSASSSTSTDSTSDEVRTFLLAGETGCPAQLARRTQSSDEDDDHARDRNKTLLVGAGCAVFVVAIIVAVFWARQRASGMVPSAPATTAYEPAGDQVATDTPAETTPTPSSSPPATSDNSSSAPAKPTPSSNGPNSGPYKLLRTYAGERFFDGWDFWKDADPTHGTVNYVDQAAARAAGLISASAKSAVMRVDNTTRLAPGANRKSVRIHSKEPVKLGSLVIADILRMPFGCATWPAYWTHGPQWPNGGEIVGFDHPISEPSPKS